VYICQQCEQRYQKEDGILCLIGEGIDENHFFPTKAFDRLFRLEGNNFWFLVRNKIIGNTFTRYLPINSRILEVGCGTGFVSQYLKKIGYHTECADIYPDALHFCKERNAGEQYYQYNLLDLIFLEEFDGICACDVLEHIDDDSKVLKNLFYALKPGGRLIITVPADMKLWSDEDIYSRHKRRYSKKELRKKLENNGFKVIQISFFMTLLYPLFFFSRKILSKRGGGYYIKSHKKNAKPGMNELQPHPLINSIFFYIFNLETPFLCMFNLPFGSSLLSVAERER
jgi:2-polyprenyl-3-methyl-5-hydroxy-6-metoxy-1,4-benzoquinol methylase